MPMSVYYAREHGFDGTPESQLKAIILEALLRLNFIILRINSGGRNNAPSVLWYLPPEMTAKHAGVMDILCVSPEGRPYWIDTKATTKPSDAQLEFAAAMEARGIICLFPRSLEELLIEIQ